MTANQLAWLAQQETARANRAKEDETRRSNLAKEAETFRSNKINEMLDRAKIMSSAKNWMGLLGGATQIANTDLKEALGSSKDGREYSDVNLRANAGKLAGKAARTVKNIKDKALDMIKKTMPKVV